MLECVINISEGRDHHVLDQLSTRVNRSLLDVHRDAHHNRSVFTLAGSDVQDDAIELTRLAVALLDVNLHQGAHPRLGVVDVVPFVPLGDAGLLHPLQLDEAVRARDHFAEVVSRELGVPCFLYGPHRSLPEIRKHAFVSISPDFGPKTPHKHAGACCVGARGVLIAYNVNVSGIDLSTTRFAAKTVRRRELRTLGLDLAGTMQVSCNLIDPLTYGIEAAYDAIANEIQSLGGSVVGTELVGLIPKRVLDAVHPSRWERLGIDESKTIEARMV